MQTINNIAKVITEQIKYNNEHKGEQITQETPQKYYNEIINALPKGEELFTRYDNLKYHIKSIMRTDNFQYLITDKGIILTNKFF